MNTATKTVTQTATYFHQDIVCLESESISTGALMSRMFASLHFAFVEITGDDPLCPIGITLPGYQLFGRQSERQSDKAERSDQVNLPQIGNSIRLFSVVEGELERLDLVRRLSRFREYLAIETIRSLRRKNYGLALYRRHQPKSTPERLIRRRMKRHGESYDVASAHYRSMITEPTSLPYLDVQSQSTQGRFRLFVEKRLCEEVSSDKETKWGFSCYGLSTNVLLPDF